MTTFEYSLVQELELNELISLYDSVGWSAYTSSPESLVSAIAGSSTVVVARTDGVLVGLARAISDGASVCFVQDLLVSPEHQRSGIGRALLNLVLEQYPQVRQRVLLTEDEPRQKSFYTSLGFTQADEVPGGELRAFVEFG